MDYGQSYSPAAERNKTFILAKISNHIDSNDQVLEIGSASGQHAMFFKEQLKCNWQASDQEEYLKKMKPEIKNILQPIVYKVGETKVEEITSKTYDVIYSANTFHIMSFKEVRILLQSLSSLTKVGSRFIYYGPFHFGGDYGAKSNLEFNQYLKNKASHMEIRDYLEIKSQLENLGWEDLKLYSMPANNHLAVFIRRK